MGRVPSGSRVKVHYTGRLDDGTTFDSSHGGAPIEFVFGEKDLIPGFEKAVGEMEVGERKTVTIPAEEAYGPHRDDLVVRVRREQLPKDISLERGMTLRLSQPGGKDMSVVIREIDDGTVVLDANHPLAGKRLTFEIELVSLS
ncbi:MAG: peptidylprolyl isomerase [Nitrospirota bacterium]